MTDASLDVVGLVQKRLAWVDQRQSVLAQNIANVNTPGYVAKDVKSFRDVLAEQAASLSGQVRPAKDSTVTARSLDGNGVVLDEQLEKVAETDGAHQLASNLLRTYMSMFRTAIGHG